MRPRLLFVAGACAPLLAMGACTSESSSPPEQSDSGFELDAASADDTSVAPTDAPSGDSANPDARTDATGGDAGSRDAAASDAPSGDSAAVDSNAPDSNLADSNTPDSSPDADGASAIDAGIGGIRVANLSPGGAAVDFCIVPQGMSFSGLTPYMSSVGVPAGVAYPQVTEYVGTPDAGTYVVRIVAAGAADCSTAFNGFGDSVVLSPTAANPWTIAVVGIAGDAGSPLTVQPYVDDGAVTAPTSGLRFRIIHVAPLAPPTDFELGAGPTWTYPLQAAVPYGQDSNTTTVVSGAPIPDAYGYLTTPIDSAQVTASVSGADVTSGYDIEYRTASLFYVGTTAASKTFPLGMLVCDDTSPSSGHLSACTLHTGAPTFGALRWMNVAADSPATEACLQLYPTGAYTNVTGGAGISGGVSFLQLTGQIVAYPDWTSYNAFVEAVGAGCSSPGSSVSSSTIGSAVNGDVQTITLVEQAFGASPSYALLVSTGDDVDETVNPGDALAGLEVTNDSYGTGAETIDVFATPSSGTESPLATALGPNGAVETEVTATTFAFRVADHGTSTNVVSVSGVSLASGSTTTLHFFDLSSTTRGLARCDAADPPAGSVTTCAE